MSYQLLQNFAVAVLKVCKVKSAMDAPVDNDDDNAQRLTTAQRVEIVRHYYHNDDNATRTAAVMSQLMNRVIQRQTVSKLIAKFERLGSVVDAPRSGDPQSKWSSV